MTSQAKDSDSQELGRGLHARRERPNPDEPKLQNQIETSESKSEKQSSLVAALFMHALRQVIPTLETGRQTHEWREKKNRRWAWDHRIERELLPRLRRHLVAISDALEPSRLKDLPLSEDPSTEIGWIDIITNDASQLKSSIIVSWSHWERSEPTPFWTSAQSQNTCQIDIPKSATYWLRPYHYPEIHLGVDRIRNGIAELFKAIAESLRGTESPSVGKKEKALRDVLQSINWLIADLEDPRRVLRSQWQINVREIEIMELAVVKCLQPTDSHKNTKIEGICDRDHLRLHRWTARKDMSHLEVELLQDLTSLLKICRILLHKLSSSTSSEPFMTSQMKLKQLKRIHTETEAMESKLRKLTVLVLKRRLRGLVNQIDCYFEDFVLIVDEIQKHLDTLDPGADPTQLRKAREWCQMWTAQHQFALQVFVRKANSLFIIMGDSDSEEDDSDTDSLSYSEYSGPSRTLR
ncbi:hypothetical protein PtB15_4B405 [Puccinia triticina]|nr:hypothetical protein PtB15_4B405 [Puccinia triticina]